jgi:hypothetical protein
MIKLSHYLYFLTEVNRMLEVCMEMGEYSTIVQNCSIEGFLNSRRNYDMNAYNQLKPKLLKLEE